MNPSRPIAIRFRAPLPAVLMGLPDPGYPLVGGAVLA